MNAVSAFIIIINKIKIKEAKLTTLKDVEVGNHASQAVLRANGFEMARTEMQPWPDEKGGGEREMGVWVWTDRR